MTIDSSPTQQGRDDVVDWTDLGREMWSFLTGQHAALTLDHDVTSRAAPGSA